MKTAIITGANRGIGEAITLHLAASGWRVVLSARDATLLHAVAAKCPAALPVALDLREPDAPAQLVDAAIEHFGSVDAIINNAGATKRGDFETLTDADWLDGYALKLFGAVRLTRAAWPYLKTTSGSVLNIAGVGGKTPGAQFTIGGSVNAALLSFTKALADQGISDHIQVNAINPGPVRTARLQKRLETISESDFIRTERITRIGEPQDVASLAAYLLSPAGRWIHGSLIDIDGGNTKSL